MMQFLQKVILANDSCPQPLMGNFKINVSDAPIFILTGFPGMEAVEPWLSFPLLLLYAIAIVGNTLILLTVKEEPSLHQPMY